MTEREREKHEEIINYEKDVIKKFAEKIKSHMMMYCQSRIEQQYCALEVIDYIGKLMGEKDFSIDVEKEIKEHDEKIRAKTIEECKEVLRQHWLHGTVAYRIINEIGESLEQLKEQKNK